MGKHKENNVSRRKKDEITGFCQQRRRANPDLTRLRRPAHRPHPTVWIAVKQQRSNVRYQRSRSEIRDQKKAATAEP